MKTFHVFLFHFPGDIWKCSSNHSKFLIYESYSKFLIYESFPETFSFSYFTWNQLFHIKHIANWKPYFSDFSLLLWSYFAQVGSTYESVVKIIPSFSFMKVNRAHLWKCTWNLSKFVIFPETFMKVQLKSFHVAHLWKLPRDIYKSAPEIFPCFSFSQRHLWKCSWNHSKFLIHES